MSSAVSFISSWCHPFRTRLLTISATARPCYRHVARSMSATAQKQQPPSTAPPQPDTVPSSTNMFSATTFADLCASDSSIASLSRAGIITPTKAQAAVVPIAQRGLALQLDYARQIKHADQCPEDPRPSPPQDDDVDVLMVGAETGCGKTLAYLLPYVDAVRNSDFDLKAIVLVPSRELCYQTESFLRQYFDEPPQALVLAGGNPPDVADVKDVKVVIATPGALLNYFRFSQKHDTSDKYIIVDEADMLLTGGFLADMERILDQPGMKPFATRKNKKLRAENRNRLILIGATYPHWTGERVRSIVTWMKRRYPGVKAVQTEDIHKRNELLRSRWRHLNTEAERLDALEGVLREADADEKILVFGSKAETMAHVCATMESRLDCDVEKFGAALQLHKLVHGKDRVANLERFRSGEARLLFCTDLGARGLDLGDVTRVVEFEFSKNVVGFLHRIGRTARAGAAGATDHFYDDVTRPLAEAIRERAEEGTTVVEGVFSRNRSFRRKLKKKLAEEQVAQSLEDVVIDEIDEEEEARLRGE